MDKDIIVALCSGITTTEITCKVFEKKFKNDGLLLQINSEKQKRNFIYEETENEKALGNTCVKSYYFDYIDVIKVWNLQLHCYVGAWENNSLNEIVSYFFNEQINADELRKKIDMITMTNPEG